MNPPRGLSPTGVSNPVDDWNCFLFIHSSKHSIEEGDFQSPLGAPSHTPKHGQIPMGKCTFLSELSVLPAPQPTPFRNRFGIVSESFRSRFGIVSESFRNRQLRIPPSLCQSECKKPWDGGLHSAVPSTQSECDSPLDGGALQVRPGACPQKACQTT